ncbi:Serine/threonine-protein kinase PrkC [Stieleria maiorica]|uniref:Serine/threonine-protein kinase PrkC n=1 Tax=Stieleria maiorica TaxID=2795974 RepID=A0A5B9MJA6_9BACT|nr:serine/threonine-protein kinase [Stieleria maiorica]QEG00530.1 Serine/threonine-protein kinase PrkC [Stieleria maiorica]
MLDERCGADDGLKSEVFRLLELDRSRGNFLDRFASAVGADPGETAKTLQSIGIAGSLALDSVVGTLGQIGRFELRKLVGRGGMGNVFLAQDMELQRPVALKFPRIERLTSEEERERFFREARLSAKFNHPNLVTVYEVGVLGQMCFIASEWFDGGDFAAWLEKHPGPHNPRWCAELVRPLARAIAYCHDQGVAHLDLKPVNITLAMESEQDPMKFRPMLTDFSIARVFEGELSQTNFSMLLGTPLYMAPEQAACDRDSIGPQSDVYALGVVLHEL